MDTVIERTQRRLEESSRDTAFLAFCLGLMALSFCLLVVILCSTFFHNRSNQQARVQSATTNGRNEAAGHRKRTMGQVEPRVKVFQWTSNDTAEDGSLSLSLSCGDLSLSKQSMNDPDKEPPPPTTPKQPSSRDLILSRLKTLSSSFGGVDSKGRCVICFRSFQMGDTVCQSGVTANSCCHVLHLQCMGVWLADHDTCPICRHPFLSEEQEAEEQV